MKIGSTVANALSGISSAARTREVASHNVANLLTEDFRPLRSHQTERQGGGSQVLVERAERPESVDLAAEFVRSDVASLQAKASLRLIDAELELTGKLVDILA
jgi:hypothetical protein